MQHINPQRIGYMTAPLSRIGSVSLVVTGMVGFDLLNPSSFMTDQDIWEAIEAVTGDDGIWDLWMPKTFAEVLVWGNAEAATPVSAQEVAVRCGSVHKRLRISGERHWQPGPLGWRASEPVPFKSAPVAWRNAYGGTGHPTHKEGVGWDAEIKIARADKVLLPQVEYLHDPQRQPGQRAQPAGFQPMDVRWNPQEISGTFGGEWLARQHPAMPPDFDWSYYNRAPLDQRLKESFWRGDEDVSIGGMNAEHPQLQARLPNLGMRCFSTRSAGGELQHHPMVLDTVCLLPSTRTCVLIFRCEITDAGVDAHLLESIMLGAEWLHQPKTLAHYQSVFDLRTDDETSMDYVLADHQLMPELTQVQAEEKKEANSIELAEEAEKAQQRAIARRALAAAALGASAGTVQASVPVFPRITKKEVALGQIDIAPIAEAAAQVQARAAQDLNDWDVEARDMLTHAGDMEPPQLARNRGALPESLAATNNSTASDTADSAENPEAPASGPPGPEIDADTGEASNKAEPGLEQLLSQFNALANSLESDLTQPAQALLGDWAKGLSGISEDRDMLMPDILKGADIGPAERSELVASLRRAAQTMQEGMRMVENPDGALESMLAQVPVESQPAVRDMLKTISAEPSESASGDPFAAMPPQIKALMVADNPAAMAQMATQFMGVNDPVIEEALDKIKAGVAGQADDGRVLMVGKGLSALSPELLTPANAQGLSAWMSRQTEARNPLIDAIEDMALETGGPEASLDKLIRASPSVAANPAMAELMQNHAQAAELAELSEQPMPPFVQAAWDQAMAGKNLSLDGLLAMINSADQPEKPETLEVLAQENTEAGEVANDALAAPEDAAGLESLDAADVLAQSLAATEATQAVDSSEKPAGAAAAAAAAAIASRTVLSDAFVKKMAALQEKGASGLLSARSLARRNAAPTERGPEEMLALSEQVRKGHLQGQSFKGQDLTGINLSGANLQGIDLQGAWLEGADLSGADLSRASCAGAVLTGAIMRRAKLREADFSNCNLSGVNAEDSVWDGADLSGSLLGEACFSSASMHKVNLNRCEGSETIFERADLRKSLCNDGELIDTDLSHAQLQGAQWNKVMLLNARVDGLKAADAVLTECLLSGACGEYVDFSRSCLDRANLIRAVLPRLRAPQMHAEDSSWLECDLHEAVLEKAMLSKAILIKANLHQANLSSAYLRDAMLTGATLSQADLSSAQLLDVSLRGVLATGANLSGANLEGADITGAVLDRCDLTGTQIVDGLLSTPTHV
jgi:uncharacterized protein YjbI with pentapeptide repeats